MSKTYRSMFLTCGACKRGLESDVKYCKYCGKTIWLKDANVSAPVEIAKPVTEDDLKKRKLQNVLEKWLPTIFPDYHYVAPAPMPKETLDFLMQHMGKERTYSINILGYGFDSVNNRFYVFDDKVMYYKSVGTDEDLYEMAYLSIKELMVGNRQLIINTNWVGTASLTVFREKDFAEMLASITGAIIKVDEGLGVSKVTIGENSALTNAVQPVVEKSSKEQKTQEVAMPLTDSHQIEMLTRKAYYTVNDYIRANGGCIMALMMLATLVSRVSLVIQGYYSFHAYQQMLSRGAVFCAILFAGFAFLINYYQWWMMVLAWSYCVVVADKMELGTAWFPSEWYESSLVYLTVALVCRFIIGIRYKRDVKDGQVVADNKSEIQNTSTLNLHTKGKAQKTGYTIKEYIRNHKNVFMSLIMFGAKVCLMLQSYSDYFYGEYAGVMKLMYSGLILFVFAFLISYCRPWMMIICWFFFVINYYTPGFYAEFNLGTSVVVFLTAALICRFILGRRYKAYMASNQTQQIPKEGK